MIEPEWSDVRSKVSNSVFQLNVIEGIFNPLRPYSEPRDRQSSGSGFLVDAKRGLVVTNAHVVDNAMSVWGSAPNTGKLKIRMKVLSAIRDKDVALVKIHNDDLAKIIGDKSPEDMEIKLGDSLGVRQTDKIMIAGYHLGQRQLSFTTGVVSTFHTEDTGFGFSTVEDSYSRDATYMTTTAPMNPGVSGSPLLNREGKAIGINAAGRIYANGIGYAISSRVLMSLIPIMLKEQQPNIPTMSLRWSPTDESTRKFVMGDVGKDREGIMVRDVYDDSIFSGLERKDILQMVGFSLDTTNKHFGIDDIMSREGKKVPVTAVFDSLGDIDLRYGKPMKTREEINKSEKVIDRKIPISELADLIPVGSDVDVVFNRGKRRQVLRTKNEHKPTSRIYGVYPVYTPFEYEFVGGMVITPLLLNQAAALGMDMIDDGGDSDSFLFNNHLLVSQVFPETSASETGAINAGDILVEVNDIPVSTMKELNEAIRKGVKGSTTFTMANKTFVAIDNTVMASDRKKAMKMAGVSDKK